jgi:hemolysin III
MGLFAFREPVSAWSHCLWMLLSLPATYLLLRRCGGDWSKRFSLLVFGLSLLTCYLGSTLYHGVRLPQEKIDLFDRIDHIGIYVLIAGSYTPLAWCLLRGRWKWGILTVAWFLAAAGTVLVMTCGVLPMFWSTLMYLAMGWGAIFCYFELARLMSHRALRPLLTGGVLYSVGAVLNLLHWPELWPGVFRAHELFHLFVMAGSLAHFWFMLTVVAPSPSESLRPLSQPTRPGFRLALLPIPLDRVRWKSPIQLPRAHG